MTKTLTLTQPKETKTNLLTQRMRVHEKNAWMLRSLIGA